jgi:hypothetical protein
MVNVRMRPGFGIFLALCGISVVLLAQPARARAEPNEAGGSAKNESSASEAPSPLSEVIQAGAKLLGKGAKAEPPHKELTEAEPRGTSSHSAKKAALAALPLDQLSPEHRQRVNALLKSASFFRRLPKVTFSIEPEVYTYFISHPDVAVSIWRAMKISKLQMWQTGRFDYEADAGDGSTGALQVLYSGPEKSLVACDGIYKSPMFAKPIEARSLLLLQTSFFREADGTIYVTHRADLFVEFPSQTIDVVAKIFSPLTVSMTDRTFAEISVFLKMMSLAMSGRPDWVEQIAAKMEGIPEIRKSQVLELTDQVHTAAQKRSLERIAEKEGLKSGARETRPADGPAQSAVVPASAVEAAAVAGSTPPMPRTPPDEKPTRTDR